MGWGERLRIGATKTAPRLPQAYWQMTNDGNVTERQNVPAVASLLAVARKKSQRLDGFQGAKAEIAGGMTPTLSKTATARHYQSMLAAGKSPFDG